MVCIECGRVLSGNPWLANLCDWQSLFPQVRFNLENGKSFVIKARRVSKSNLYIQSATLNGRPYTKSFITHKDLMSGGELIFEMGPRPNLNWGASDTDVPVSELKAPEIVPVPIIQAFGRTFKDFLLVTVSGISKDLEFHFTTDGSEPTIRSQRFTRAILLDKSATVKAIAIDRQRQTSLVATANYHQIPHKWSLVLTSKYSSQYHGGGDLAMIDGIEGPLTGAAVAGRVIRDKILWRRLTWEKCKRSRESGPAFFRILVHGS